MSNKDNLIQTALYAVLLLSTTTMASATTQPAATEKCYGIVKAGMNDCATSTQSCAGSATQDKQSDAFLFMPKGLCQKISGGQLNAPAKKEGK